MSQFNFSGDSSSDSNNDGGNNQVPPEPNGNGNGFSLSNIVIALAFTIGILVFLNDGDKNVAGGLVGFAIFILAVQIYVLRRRR